MPSSASRDDVEGDEQAVVAPHHRARLRRQLRRRGRAPPDRHGAKSARNRSRENRSALARIAAGSNGVRRHRVERRRRSASTELSSTSTPVTPSTHGFAARRPLPARPPACRRPAPRPGRCRSPRRPGSSTAAARLIQRRESPRPMRQPRNSTPGAGQPSQPRLFGPSPDDAQRRPEPPAGIDGDVEALVGHERGHDEEAGVGSARGSGRGGKRSYRQEDTQRSTRDYSIGGSCPQHIESSRQSGRPARPSPRPTAPARPSPAAAAGSRPRRPDPARSRRRTGPTRSASASGSSRRGPPRPARRPTSPRSGWC